jgi:hypothetical protein
MEFDMVEAFKRNWLVTVLAMVFCLCLGTGLALVIGRTQEAYWIVFGGNTDPGDGDGGGMARDQFVAGGWVDSDHIYQVQWKADISQGATLETNAAMPAAHSAFEAHCHSNRCIIAGFSLGNSPALQLSAEVGQPPSQTYLFGAPQPSTGVFHHYAPDNPFVNPFLQAMGGLNTQRPVSAGMQAFYANAAPQCTGPGLFALSVNPGHRIITTNEAERHVWTGTDGVVMHEADYQGPQSVPLSGSDPSPLWAGCPISGWQNQPGEIPPPVPGGTGPTQPGEPLGTLPVAPPPGG